MKDKTFTSEDIQQNAKKNLDKIEDRIKFANQQAINNISDIESYSTNWVDMKSIKSKRQPWLWEKIIASEGVTLIAGVGGVGKSSLLLGFSAAITNGSTVSICGEEVSFIQGGVIYLGAEDKVDTSIKPKLEVFNTNFNNFHYTKDQIGDRSKKRKGLSLDVDLALLEEKIIAVNADPNIANIRLIIIDPITYFMGCIKDYINTEVANFIMRLNTLAEQYSVAIVICKHLRKPSSGNNLTNIVNEIGGSAAWSNSPRMAWAVYEHPDDSNIKLMTNIKANIVKRHSKSLNFTLKEYTLPGGVEATGIKWGSQLIEIDPNLAANAEAFLNSKLQKAINFIFDYLETRTQCYAKDAQQAGIEDGHTKKTMRNAIDAIRSKYKHRVQEDKDGASIILKLNKYDS